MSQDFSPFSFDPFDLGGNRRDARNAEKNAQQAAEQEKNAAIAEQQRLEEKYGLSPGELERQDRTFALEKERQTALQGRAGKTGEQLISEEGGPGTAGLVNRVNQRLGKSGKDLFLEEGGQPAQDYYNRVTAPTDQGTFGNELELVRQTVNAEANRRGVFGGLPEGGIRFEQLGRAGVELAIKSAREKMTQQQSLATGFINLAQNARAEAGTVGERALTASGGARNELDAFLANQQQLNQASQGRAASVGLGAANLADQGIARSYNTVQDIYGQQVGRAQAEEDRNLAMLGDIAGFALAPATGGASLALPALTSGSASKVDPGQYQKLRVQGYSSRDY